VKVQNANTAAPGGEPRTSAGAWTKKIFASRNSVLREKGRNFVDALINERLVDPELISRRLTTVHVRYRSSIAPATLWFDFRIQPRA
jgi:hypothetical protein